MEKGIIKAADRNVVRSIKMAMQGNAIRALVELITNSDDSYIRLKEAGIPSRNSIEILYEKDGYSGRFAVRDNAEGMSIEDVRGSFKKYGEATSGLKSGKGVRGYFGQGAKDALAGMMDGKICTFKDDKYVECRLYIESEKPWFEIEDEVAATAQLRKKHGIEANGTIAYFVIDPKRMTKTNVPRLDTVHEELAGNYLLRKIMTNEHRKLFLIDVGDKANPRRIRYQVPEGKPVLSERVLIPYGDYEDFPINITIMRAEKELNQTGDKRDGGLLIIDDKNVVLSCSLFKYDNEPLAARLLGEVQIERFRELLEKEEPVLNEEREGLNARHPFCCALIMEVERFLECEIKREKLRRQKEEQGKFDRDEISRFKKAFNFLNDIAEQEAEAAINLAQKQTDVLDEPPDGFCLYPQSARISVGKRYVLELRLNTHIIHYGSTVNIGSSHPKLHVLTREFKVTPDDGVGIVQKFITIEGMEPNIEGIIRASTKEKATQTKIFVEPEKELLLSEGMLFQPESITLRPNQPRKVCLLVYIKMIEGGSVIKLATDNDSVKIPKNEIEVNEADAVRHIAKYEFVLWGEGAGQDAIVTATCGSYCALLDVRIRSKEEKEERGKKGMFSEPEYSYDEDPLQRISYSGETGIVTIYVNFPAVRLYLGTTCQYKKTLSAQVLIADLVAERCFYEIAKKKVDTSGALIRPEARYDRIQSVAYDLSRKYGKKVHEVLVDQKSLTEQQKTS